MESVSGVSCDWRSNTGIRIERGTMIDPDKKNISTKPPGMTQGVRQSGTEVGLRMAEPTRIWKRHNMFHG